MDAAKLKQSLMGKFVEVTGDRLQNIQLALLELEKPDSGRHYENIARELHTMKGEARMLGLAVIGDIAHSSEDLLKAQKEGTVSLKEAVDLALKACDVVADLLEDIEVAKTGNVASKEIITTLQSTSKHAANEDTSTPKGSVVVPKKSKHKKETTRKIAENPEPGSSVQEKASSEFMAAASKGNDDSFDRKLPGDRSIRVQVEALDEMASVAGDLLVASAKARRRNTELTQMLENFALLSEGILGLTKRILSGDEQAARDWVEKYESQASKMRDTAFRFVRQNADGLNVLHEELERLATQVADSRLVPLASVFEAFPRAVRDLSTQLNKKIELEVDHAGVGVDRSMVSEVRDAMVHLLRNAIGHGIEDEEQREALGKKPFGTLSIRSRVDGDMLALEVSDDGRGIDPNRLRTSAVSKRLLTADSADTLSDREAIELIFRPGFSTKDEVDDISGRGVGLDVVKRKVESIGGSVSVRSRVGIGTTFILRMPQSLTLMRVLMVRLAGDVYGIPVADIESVARFGPKERREVLGALAVEHRGVPTPLAPLGSLLGLNGGPTENRPPAVVLRHGSERAALMVDGLLDEREVAVKPCGGEFFQGAAFIAGTAALEDGRIAVLLHVPDIMAEVRRLSKPSDRESARRLKVLLVDDSPIARATEGALARALGHTVDEAVDGEDGWALAQKGEYDLILTDVQMPKLNGFELTKRLKSDVRLAKIPVIIMSSLASTDDKRRGVDAGANAYLVKGELSVEALASTIDRLT